MAVVSIDRLKAALTNALACVACACGRAAVPCIAALAGLGGLAGLAGLGGLAGLAWPADADADGAGYHVYSCRTPGGAAAPVDGWTGSVADGGAYDDYATNTCAEGGALIAALGELTIHAANVDEATWAFEAPQSEKIAGASLWRAARLQGQIDKFATYQFALAGPRKTEVFDACVVDLGCQQLGNVADPLSVENRVVVPGGNLGAHLYVNVSCGVITEAYCEEHTDNANEYAAAGYLYAADIKLEQSAGPSVSDVTGELASASTLRGTSDLAFDASDPGSGVYEAVFSVDGEVVQRTVVDENGGRCVDVGGTGDGLPAFLYTQPCKASVSVDVPFDSTRVSDGTHHLLVTVTDAAGNSAPVLDREVTISNPPPPGTPNGTNASAQAALSVGWAGTRKARLTGSYGRAHTIEGRLTGPGGVPIADAQIDCTATPAYAGAKTAAIACPKTGAGGRFAVLVPGGAGSRTLRFAYREHLGDALPVATRTLELTVRAVVRLQVKPHRTSVGRRIFFTGKLLGGPIPRGGKQLVLEARSVGGPWIEFDVVRTDGRGRYHASYRFKFPGPASYSFRAVSESEADYPFAAGASNTVAVHEL